MISPTQVRSIRHAYAACVAPLTNLLHELETVAEVDDKACKRVIDLIADCRYAKNAEDRADELERIIRR